MLRSDGLGAIGGDLAVIWAPLISRDGARVGRKGPGTQGHPRPPRATQGHQGPPGATRELPRGAAAPSRHWARSTAQSGPSAAGCGEQGAGCEEQGARF